MDSSPVDGTNNLVMKQETLEDPMEATFHGHLMENSEGTNLNVDDVQPCWVFFFLCFFGLFAKRLLTFWKKSLIYWKVFVFQLVKPRSSFVFDREVRGTLQVYVVTMYFCMMP